MAELEAAALACNAEWSENRDFYGTETITRASLGRLDAALVALDEEILRATRGFGRKRRRGKTSLGGLDGSDQPLGLGHRCSCVLLARVRVGLQREADCRMAEQIRDHPGVGTGRDEHRREAMP